MYDRTAHVYDLLYAQIKDYPAEASALTDLTLERCPGAGPLLDVTFGTGRRGRTVTVVARAGWAA